MKAGQAIISQMTNDDIATLEAAGSYNLQIEDRSFDLTLEDFEIVTDEIPGMGSG